MNEGDEALVDFRQSIMSGAPRGVSPELAEKQWRLAVEYIESGAPATLCTLHKDGRPQQTLAWVGVEGHTLLIASTADFLKLKNMRRDPRVLLSFSSGTKNELGVLEYLVIEGTAEVTVGGAVALLKELAPRYRDDDADLGVLQTEGDGWVTRITPTRIRGVGPWQDVVQT